MRCEVSLQPPPRGNRGEENQRRCDGFESCLLCHDHPYPTRQHPCRVRHRHAGVTVTAARDELIEVPAVGGRQSFTIAGAQHAGAEHIHEDGRARHRAFRSFNTNAEAFRKESELHG